jgi:single-stranded-DNA-specific exonuclease
MKWRKPPVDVDRVRLISERFDIDALSAAILVRRGVTEGHSLPYYLEDDLRYLHDPFNFGDMPDLVMRLVQARDEGERVLVFGDRDVDGITSTALLVRTLRDFGIEQVDWEVPEGDSAYGLTVDAVDRHAERDGSLVLTIDCGITNIEEIAYASEIGIETIVIDHHNPHDELPPAIAIINPKVGSEYPFDGLCACALAAKVRQAIAIGETELFGQTLTLLTAYPTNETVMVDAILLENGIVADRVSEALVPGIAAFESSRLAPFLVDKTLVTYDVPMQTALLKQALGANVDVYMLDLAEQVAEQFPSLANKSLLEMREGSRMARYTDEIPAEIDVLLALYRSLVDARFPAIRRSIDSVLDAVAIATLVDMMPILDENRILVRAGLAKVNSDPDPAFTALIAQLGLTGRTIGSREVGWNIGPVINASGRMGTPSIAVRLLLSSDESERRELAAEIHGMNRRRRQVGDEAWRAVLPRVDESVARHDGKLIAMYEPNVHRGVTGIVAGRLSRRYNLPAAVITSVGDMAIGSIRSARGFVATDFLANFEDILEKWGGHDQAAGFNFPGERLDRFWDRLSDVIPRLTLDVEREEEVVIDAELPAKYFNPDLQELVRRFEPYGQENPQLRFLARNVVVEDLQIIGKEQDHLRLRLAGGGYKWPAVFWGAADRVGTQIVVGSRVDVVFEFSWNFYQGVESIQLVVIDLRPSEEQVVDETA